MKIDLTHIQKMSMNHFDENKIGYLFTTVLFMMGIISGAMAVNSLPLVQKQDLFMYVNQFFGQVESGDVAPAEVVFIQSVTHYMKYFALMWLLGLSIIGLPVILVLLFLKGVVVGFTVGFLVNQMGVSGFVLSFVSIMPQNLILVPAFVMIGTASITFCLKMVRQQFFQKSQAPIVPQFLKYSLFVFVIGSSIVFASAFEAYLSMTLIKLII